MKRVKSFFISLGSFAIASLGTLVLDPRFHDAVVYVGNAGQNKLLVWGVPSVIVVVIGLFISEIWRSLINSYILKNAGFDNTKVTHVVMGFKQNVPANVAAQLY